MADEAPALTVGSLVGVPLGTAPGPFTPPPTAQPSEVEGPNWSVDAGEARVGSTARAAIFRPDGVEALTFSNPFGQVMERVWFDRKVVFAVDLGEVEVDPEKVNVAQEYQVVYAVELDSDGKLIGEPEMVEGQLNIYDTVPGMERYSPIWQFNYVVVPRDYKPNTLRSEADCLTSGYPIHRGNVFEN